MPQAVVASLHFCKGAEWAEKDIIEKACKWLEEELTFNDFSSDKGSYGKIIAYGLHESLDAFIANFRKSLEK